MDGVELMPRSRVGRGTGRQGGHGAEYPITYYHMITVAVKEKLEKFNPTWSERAVRMAKPLKRKLLGGAGRRETVF